MKIKELYTGLKKIGVSDNSFYLQGLYGSTNDDDKIALVIKNNNGFIEYEVYFKERGQKHSVKIFNNEDDACQYIYKRLKNINQIQLKYFNKMNADKSSSDEDLFMHKLNKIIQEINEAYYLTEGYNSSYKILIETLTEIRNISDFSEETDGILYFLRDSYDGDRNVIEELQKLLLKYRKRK